MGSYYSVWQSDGHVCIDGGSDNSVTLTDSADIRAVRDTCNAALGEGWREVTATWPPVGWEGTVYCALTDHTTQAEFTERWGTPQWWDVRGHAMSVPTHALNLPPPTTKGA